MTRYNNRSPTPLTKPYGSGHPHNSVAGVQIIQYRSYQREISIYHLRTHLLPLRVVRVALQNQKEYLDRLTSFDPLRGSEVVEGDEIPAGCIEAAFLPNILHGHGCALALRSQQEPGRVEWFVFSGPIDQNFLSQIVSQNGGLALQSNTSVDDSRKVFDLVGYAEKGLKVRRVRGANREHKGWHDSLCAAEEVKKSVKLTWRGFRADLRAEHERKKSEETANSTEEQEEGWRGGTSTGEEGDTGPSPQKDGDADDLKWNVAMRSKRNKHAGETATLGSSVANGMSSSQPL
ncbi:hypothetical protein EJ07DRAFT_179787 [Lizonia empirigonia]|nr:hypothetical protein EJ07DRAFT_179787 [Lizonia empirigonia]